jgi:hypothetical protein
VFRAGKHLRARGKYSLIAPIRKSHLSATRMSDPRSWTLSRAAA